MKRSVFFGAALFCAACDGPAPFTSAGAPAQPFTAGPIARISVPNTGEIAGLPAANVTVVRKNGLGFAYGAGRVSNADVRGTGAASTGYHAVTGPLAGNQIGAGASGSATFSGTYEVIFVPLSTSEAGYTDDRNLRSTGKVDLAFDFSKGQLTATTTATTGDALTIANGATLAGTFSGAVTHRETGGVLNGQVGQNGAVGTMVGSGPQGFFAGGLVATP